MTTLHDIAKKANVSYMTVARVLSGQNKENRPSAIAKASRIRRVAQEMGYRPNAAARAVTQGKFNNIVLVLSHAEVTSYLPISLCWSIEDNLMARRCRLTLNHISDLVLTNDALLSGLLGEAFADGMLIDYTHHVPSQFGQLLQKHRIPAIWLNTMRSHDAVRPDDFQGGMLATEHLLAQGHTRIAYLDVWNYFSPAGDGTIHYSAHDRHAGYLEAMKKAGLPPLSYLTKKNTQPLPLGDAPIDEILAPNGPTALISYGHECLVRLHTYAEMRQRKIQLVTFGEHSRTLCSEIPVDTVLIPTANVGKAAVDMLFEKIASPEEPLPSIVVPYERVTSFHSAIEHDGLRAAARSFSICVAPKRAEQSASIAGNNNQRPDQPHVRPMTSQPT